MSGELKKIKLLTDAPEQPIPGVAQKPDFCYNACPRAYEGTGFVPDWVPRYPKLAVMIDKPDGDSATDRMPMAGGYGGFFWAAIARECGFKKEDVILSHVLRCYSREYPTGSDQKAAERACRNWDNYAGKKGLPAEGDSLITWAPNLFIATFPLDKMVEIGAYYSLALQDFRKALRFADAGYRPMVLMGTEALLVVAPWLQGRGGEKSWRGHWWEGEWKWQQPQASSGRFIPARELGYSRNRPKPFRRTEKKKKEPVQPTLFQ